MPSQIVELFVERARNRSEDRAEVQIRLRRGADDRFSSSALPGAETKKTTVRTIRVCGEAALCYKANQPVLLQRRGYAFAAYDATAAHHRLARRLPKEVNPLFGLVGRELRLPKTAERGDSLSLLLSEHGHELTAPLQIGHQLSNGSHIVDSSEHRLEIVKAGNAGFDSGRVRGCKHLQRVA